MTYAIFPPEDILDTTVARLPLSKSIAARALVLAALTPGAERPSADLLPVCDDIEALCRCLPQRTGKADCGLSGTALRFLTAFYAATEGVDITLRGADGLSRRPVGPLVDSLRQMGAKIEYLEREGFAPLHIVGTTLSASEPVKVDASISSQYVSALCMIAPRIGGLTIDFGAEFPSRPYVEMTLRMLESRGITTAVEGYSVRVGGGELHTVTPESEGDWSAASYWYEIVALSAGFATLPRLDLPSLQGDSVLAKFGERFGVSTTDGDAPHSIQLSASPEIHSRLDLDMSHYPDLVPALAVTSALIGVPFHFSNISHLRHKESDRLSDLAECLSRIGVIVELTDDSMAWEGETAPVLEIPRIDPHGDHRLAMAMAPAAFAAPGILIDNPGCVEKSYPGFWDDLRDAGFKIEVS